MTTQKTGSGRGRTILLGALGFGIGLGIAGGIYGALTFQIQDFEMNVLAGALLFALGGALGGALLGITRTPRLYIALFALAAAVALGVGYFLTVQAYAAFIQPSVSGESNITLAYVLQFGLIGAVVGGLLGLVQRNLGQIWQLALMGLFGFAIGFFLQDLLGSQLNEPLSSLVPGQLGDPTHDSLTLAIAFGLSFLVAGLIGGAALGLGLNPSEHKEEHV